MRRRRAHQPGLWILDGPVSGLTYTEQAALWRAAAKGHAANGRTAESQSCLENARMIERVRDGRFAPKTSGRSDQRGSA